MNDQEQQELVDAMTNIIVQNLRQARAREREERIADAVFRGFKAMMALMEIRKKLSNEGPPYSPCDAECIDIIDSVLLGKGETEE